MNIRPETTKDYAAIAEIHVNAFGGRIAEALIVTLQRQRQRFDPELSLVAEIDNRIVGHVLFSTHTLGLMGDTIQAVNLAPIGIDPNYQRQGIGKSLLGEGHRIAKQKGYSLSFLLGHDTYYPRFGYKIGAYGAASVEISRQELGETSVHDAELIARTPKPMDRVTLSALCITEDYFVDFLLMADESFLNWVSPNPNIQAVVYTLDQNTVVGYARFHKDTPHKPHVFLAHNAETARKMAAKLIGKQPSITLPLHPYSKSAEAFASKPTVQAWSAGMACSLAPNPFDEYYAQLQTGKRLPGRVIWPVAFDVE